MNVSPRPSISWEPFTFRDRSFRRVTWSEARGPEGALTVAETVAGRYQIDDLFGAGESSVLLRARDLHTCRPVLIKALRSDLLLGPPPAGSGIDPVAALTAEIRRARHLLQTDADCSSACATLAATASRSLTITSTTSTRPGAKGRRPRSTTP